jgi:polo-like kinase 1
MSFSTNLVFFCRLQVNFTDETKVVLSSEGRMVTYIDKQGGVSVHKLDEVFANSSLLNRIKYTRDILSGLIQRKTSFEF